MNAIQINTGSKVSLLTGMEVKRGQRSEGFVLRNLCLVMLILHKTE